jgi:hypothetical protein
MGAVLALLARWEAWIYGGLGVLASVCLIVFWAAYRRYERTPFGLERDAARRLQNAALAGLFALGLAGVAVFGLNRYADRSGGPLIAGTPAPAAASTPLPTPTPITSAGPLTVDSSGCENPEVTLIRPAPNQRLSGVVEVEGTANIPNFAFYQVEISGVATNGAWVTLAVGNLPKVQAVLGSFDTSPYQPGDYAFRLVVTDNVGRAAPPCVIVVSFAGGAPAPAP